MATAGGVAGALVGFWTSNIIPALLFEADAERMTFVADRAGVMTAAGVSALIVLCCAGPAARKPARHAGGGASPGAAAALEGPRVAAQHAGRVPAGGVLHPRDFSRHGVECAGCAACAPARANGSASRSWPRSSGSAASTVPSGSRLLRAGRADRPRGTRHHVRRVDGDPSRAIRLVVVSGDRRAALDWILVSSSRRSTSSLPAR